MSVESLEIKSTNLLLDVSNGTTQTLQITEGLTLDLFLSEMGLQGPTGAAGSDGINGEDGRGVVSVVRTSGTGAPGTTDTYTITYTDSTTSTFNVYNGADGSGSVSSVGLAVPVGLTVSNSPVTTSGTIILSYSAGYSLPTTASQSNWDAAYGWGNHALAGYLNTSAIGTTVQAYDADLTAISSLSGTSGFLKKTSVDNWVLDTNTYIVSQNINGIVKSSGTTLSAAVAGTDYQPALVSGTNIKTVNSTSLLGSGNIVTGDVTTTGTQTLTNKTLSGAILNDGYTEEVFSVTGTTPSLSPSNGSIQTWTLTGNSTPAAGTWTEGQSITLMIDDGSAYTVTWTSLAVTWKTNGGTAPALNTSGYTVIVLWKVGTSIYGARVGDA